MADAERLDPALLAQCQADEEPKLHQLGVGEMLVKTLPERVVGYCRVPDDGAGVGERRLLALTELIGCLEVQQLRVLRLRYASRSRPDRPLHPSILAFNGLRDVHATELFDAVVQHARAER